jgi:hypothetical protein
VERLLRERLKAAQELGAQGCGLAVGGGEDLGDRQAAEVAFEQPQLLLAPLDEAGVASAEVAGVKGAAALPDRGAAVAGAELPGRVRGQAHAVDVELRRISVGGGEGELVVVLELLEDLGEFQEEEPDRDRGDAGRGGERQLPCRGDDDQCLWLGAGGGVHGGLSSVKV